MCLSLCRDRGIVGTGGKGAARSELPGEAGSGRESRGDHGFWHLTDLGLKSGSAACCACLCDNGQFI